MMLTLLPTKASIVIFLWWTKTCLKWMRRTQMDLFSTMINGLSFSCTIPNTPRPLTIWWVGCLVKPWKRKKQIGPSERPSSQLILKSFQEAKSQDRSAWIKSRWTSKSRPKLRKRRSRRSWRDSRNSRPLEKPLSKMRQSKLRKKSLTSSRIRKSKSMKV